MFMTNLVVLDDKKVRKDGSPDLTGDIFKERIVIHPINKPKMQEIMTENLPPDSPPIFITKEEWDKMGVFSNSICEKDVPDEEMKRRRAEYQSWWNCILDRAKVEAVEYGKDKRGISKGESSETPTSGSGHADRDNGDSQRQR